MGCIFLYWACHDVVDKITADGAHEEAISPHYST